jgi:RimJ/RimL family protein N-acetyltransferase
MTNPTVLSTIPLRDGRTASLMSIRATDAEAMLNFVEGVASETDFLSFGPGEFGMTLDQEIAFLRGFEDPAKGFMLKAMVEGEMVGNAMLRRSTRPRLRHVCDLGLSVRKAFWGAGIAKALCETIFELAKREGVTRIALRVRHDNVRAIRMYERLGFAHEGRLVGSFMVGREKFDELVMGRQA